MAPIDVDPVALAAGGTALSADGEALAAALSAFSGSLTGFNAGQDSAGKVFAKSYTDNASAIAQAAVSAMGACRQVGFGIEMSAANYAAAEAGATVGGPAPSVAVPVAGSPAPVWVTIPSAYGDGIAKPMLWAMVEFFVGDLWPNGDPGAMREAAGAWKTLGEALTRIGTQIPTVKPSITGQTIPEQQKMSTAVDDIASSVSALAGMCTTIATQLNDFAGEVDKAQNAIRDLLKRLSPSGLWDTIGDLFHGESPLDEIKAVARDIKDVLRNLGREAEARVEEIKQALAALEGLADSVENWISKEFPAIAPVVNAMIDFDVGAWKNIIGLVGSVAALNPMRFAYNPEGALETWKGAAESLALITNPALLMSKIASDPHGALEMGKSLVDWEDVDGGHPMRAVGYNVTTLASFFIPGGAAAKPAALGAEAGVRAADTAAMVEARTGSALGREAAAAARIPGADIAAQTAKITEKLDGLPQVRPVEPVKPGAMEQPRPGAGLSEQPRPTNAGVPAAEPKSQPAVPSADPHPAGVPAAETRPGAVEAPPGHAPSATADAPPGQTPPSTGEPPGPTPPVHAGAPTGEMPHVPGSEGWNYSTEHYSPQGPDLAADLNDAFVHGQPTSDLASQVANHSTHHAPGLPGNNVNPDRVVLGKWAGDDAGYIGEARHNGGIYYDTGNDTWNAIGHGLSKTDADALGWQVNEQFLVTQMENGIPRIDYVVEGTRFSSIEDVLRADPNSFSAKEIKYLIENAPAYGYERIGDSWVRVGG